MAKDVIPHLYDLFDYHILRTAAAFYYIFLFIIIPLPTLVLPVYLIFFTKLWWLSVLYLTWMLLDRNTPYRGGRPGEWFRNQSVWRHFGRYFPATLVKTTDLPADRNYIFGSHPHGIMSIGNFLSFCTNATRFNEIFPGIQRSAVTLRSMFLFPFRRELVIASGAIPSDAKSIEYVLSGRDGRGRTGRMVSIVLGGAEEALDAHPDNFDLKLSTRRGFVRLALRQGASLVPVYHFGETSIYNQIDNKRGSRLRKFQQTFKDVCGFSPPIFFGRGIFCSLIGLLPLRKPINTVVGPPIHVEKCENPTVQQLDALHAEYCKKLVELFETHKTRYGIPGSAKINIY